MKNFFTGLDSENPIGTISGEIGSDFNAGAFAALLRDLISDGIRPQININSMGGSVFPALDIIDVIHQNELNTHNVGGAVSMGGMIFMFGKKRTMNDFAMIMLHTARGSADEELTTRMNNNFRKILENTTELPKEILDRIFVSEENVWFDAKEAKTFKMVDEVIPTKVSIENQVNTIVNNNSSNVLSYNDKMVKLGVIFNSAIEKLEVKTNNKMSDELKGIAAHLKLDSSSGEADILNSLKGKDKEYQELKASVDAKDKKIGELEADVSRLQKEKAEALVNSAVESGKITAESKAHYLSFAESNFEACEKAIQGIVSSNLSGQGSILDLSGQGAAQSSNSLTALGSETDILKAGYEELAKNKPELLAQLSEERPELFNKLIDEHNKK